MSMIAIHIKKHTVASAMLAMMLALSACGGAAPKATTAVITAPAANSDVLAGDTVTIQGQVDGQNITRVDVVIDSAVQGSVSANDTKAGVSTLPVVITWTTQMVGAHFVQLNVYGQDSKVIAKSDAVIFNTKAAAVAATPTSAPATPTQALPTAAAATAVITSATTTTQTTAATTTTSIAASVTISNESGFANIRSGPDTTYDLVGKLNQGETAPVKGKNQDGTWWQISFAAGTGGVGWVRADLVQANAAAANVAVVSAPAKPTAAPVPTSSGPTSTPPGVVAIATAPVVAAATATPSGPVCNASSPDWRGSNANYPFCSNKDFNWGQSDWEYTVFDNGRDGALWLAWNLYGSNVNQVWIHFVHDETICGFDRAAQRQVNEQVALSGRYDFNITQFPYGGTYKVYLEITLADGRVVQWGQKKLCIR